MKPVNSNRFGRAHKTSQLFTLILVGVFALLTGFGVGSFGATEWANSGDIVGPLPGKVTSLVEKDKEVATGDRARTKIVRVTEVQISYVLQGQDHTFTVDRSPDLAESQFPLGQSMDVYRLGERATLSPEDDMLFGPILVFIGLGVFLLGLVLIIIGSVSLKKRLRANP